MRRSHAALLLALGNPGSRYARNRHNIGFMVVDAIHRRHGFGPWKARFQGFTAEGSVDGQRILLLKPETFMNESGLSVRAAMSFLKIPLDDLVVFHDELDLMPGNVRIKKGGGNAGHNGLRSITAHCENAYRRVRIGIGHPGDKALVHHHVLNDFAKSEELWVDLVCDGLAQEAGALAKGDDAGVQQRLIKMMQEKGLA